MFKYLLNVFFLLFTLLNYLHVAEGLTVTSIKVENYTTNSITFTTFVDSSSYYLIYYLNGVNYNVDTNCIRSSTCTIKGLDYGKSYFIGACAVATFLETCSAQFTTPSIQLYGEAVILNPKITDITKNGINMTWSYASGVQTLPYTFSILANKSFLSVNQTSTNYSTTGLQEGTVYSIGLILYNGDTSVQVSWMVETYAAEPILCTITERRTKSLSFSYRMIGGFVNETLYTLYDVGSAKVYSECNKTTQTQCTITGLLPGTTYGITFQGENNKKVTGRSFYYSTYLKVSDVKLQLLSSYNDSLLVSFQSSNGILDETRYTLYVDGTMFPGCSNVKSGSCKILNLKPATQYSLQLFATNDGDTIETSSNFSTLPDVKVSSLEISMLTTRSMTIEYSSTGGSPSTVYTTKMNGVDINGCVSISTTNCLIGGLSPSNTYMITVVASSEGNNGSMTKNFSTLQSVSAPEIKVIQKSDLSLNLKLSSQYGYGPSVYEVTVNGAILPQCTNDSITCRLSPYSFNSTYEIVVKVTNDGSTNSTTLSYNIYNLPTAVKISNTSTISSISINWDESQEGIPNLTYYSASLSNNIGDNFIIFCDNVTSLLQCNFTSLTSNTTYLVRVSVYNSYFDAVNTTIQVSTLIDTRQNCKTNNNQECSGNGNCINNQCQCKSGWKGQYCEINNQNYNNPDISPNPETPVIAVDDKGIEFTFSLGFIQEIDQSINIIKSLNTTSLKWKLVKNSDRNINSTSSGTVLEKSWQYISENHEYFKSINIEFYQYLSIPSKTLNDYYQYEYAGQTYSIKLGSIKYTFNISEWNFDSKLNSIQLGSSLTSPIGGSCNGDTTITITDAGESKIIIFGDTNGNSVFGRLSNRVILDNIPRVVEHRATQVIGQKITIISIVPYFSQSLFLDPDFESLVSVDGRIDCSDNKKTRIIIGAVVGGTVGLALLILTSILIYRKRYQLYLAFKNTKKTESIKMDNRF